MKNSINWFELPVSDFDRAKKFYSSIYDYEMPEIMMGPNKMGFLPVEQGGIGGAIVHGEGYEPSNTGALIYLNGGENLSKVLAKVEEFGGKILQSKTLIEERFGYYAIFTDTEGNRIALHSMK